jgi:hypothetical protein
MRKGPDDDVDWLHADEWQEAVAHFLVRHDPGRMLPNDPVIVEESLNHAALALRWTL